MEELKSGQRIEKWDIARGILIFMVVLSHVVDYYCDISVTMRALYLFLYSFHMPCFLFLDGLFSKRNINEKRYSHIFSYLVLYLVSKGLITITLGIINHKFSFNLFSDSGLPWYGLALFFCNLITIFLKRFPKKWVLIASIILACLAGYDNNIGDFLSLSRLFVFYPFFFLGYCIDPEKLAQKLSTYRMKIYGVIVMLILAATCFLATDSVYFIRPLITGRNPYSVLSDYGMNNLVFYGGLLRLIYYVIVIFICVAFFSLIPRNMPKFRLFSYMGKRSLTIFVLHRSILYILYDGLHFIAWSQQVGISNLITIPIAIVLTLFLCLPFWDKPIRAIIYPKEIKDDN